MPDATIQQKEESQGEAEAGQKASSNTSSPVKASAGRMGSYEAGMSALSPMSAPSYNDSMASLAPVQLSSAPGAVVQRETPAAEGYDMAPKEGSGQIGTGAGWGNRSGDLKNEDGVRKNATMPDINSAAKQPNLKELEGTEDTSDMGYGLTRYSSRKSGTATGGTFKPKATIKGGKTTLSGPGAYAVWGGEAKEGIRGEWGTGDTAYGSGTVKADAHVVASGGADARAGITSSGASVSANVGGKVGAGASVSADYKTPGMAIDGVDTDLTAGVGVKGSGFVGAKLGLGGKAAVDWSKGEFELSGGAGGFAGAEGKADLHGHIGPVGGKIEAGGFVGVGAGIDGGIVFKDGKLTIGGRAWAGLGYGGKLGGSVTVDLKQAYQMGVAGAKAAYELADADGDGKLSLNDGATHIGSGLDAGATNVEKGVDSIIFVLDADGDGKFSSRDMGMRVKQAGKAVKDTVDAGVGALKDAGGKVVEGAKQLGEAGYNFLDQSGDGKLGLDDLKVGGDKVLQAGRQAVDSTIEGARQAKDTAVAWTGQKVEEGKKALQEALLNARSAADRDGDGKLGLGDIKTGAGELAEGARNMGSRAVEMGKNAYGRGKEAVGDAYTSGKEAVGDVVTKGREMASAAKNKVVGALDASGDGKLGLDDAKIAVAKGADAIHETAEAARQKAEQLASAAHSALDRDGDGAISMADAVQAKNEVKRVVSQKIRSAVATGKQTVENIRGKAVEVAEVAKTKVIEFKEAAHQTLDRTGDGSLGLDDVALGARQVGTATVRTAKKVGGAVKNAAVSTYNAAADQVSRAADTLNEGYSSAKGKAAAAIGRLGDFFEW